MFGTKAMMPQQIAPKEPKMNRTLKSTLIAAAVVLSTSAGAFAATTAWADGTVKMKDDPYKYADTLEVLHDGDKFKVFNCFENKHGVDWCKGKHDGEVGYIRLSDLDFHNGGFEVDFDNGDVEFEFGSGGFGSKQPEPII
jgi:hypothetical protein